MDTRKAYHKRYRFFSERERSKFQSQTRSKLANDHSSSIRVLLDTRFVWEASLRRHPTRFDHTTKVHAAILRNRFEEKRRDLKKKNLQFFRIFVSRSTIKLVGRFKCNKPLNLRLASYYKEIPPQIRKRPCSFASQQQVDHFWKGRLAFSP